MTTELSHQTQVITKINALISQARGDIYWHLRARDFIVERSGHDQTCTVEDLKKYLHASEDIVHNKSSSENDVLTHNNFIRCFSRWLFDLHCEAT